MIDIATITAILLHTRQTWTLIDAGTFQIEPYAFTDNGEELTTPTPGCTYQTGGNTYRAPLTSLVAVQTTPTTPTPVAAPVGVVALDALNRRRPTEPT